MLHKPRWRWLLGCLLLGNAWAEALFVIGDTGDCQQAGTPLVAAAMMQQKDWRQATLLEVGDLAYPAATREQLARCHEPYFSSFPRRLAVPGNHDWRDPGAAGFFSLFPEPVPRLAPLKGPWKLVLVDSNLQGEAWVRQLNWLEDTLSSQKNACLIAAWHHPRWSSGKHGDNEAVAALWHKVLGRVAFTLHGHDHHFEALPPLNAAGHPDPAGTPSFISGNGGAGLYKAGRNPRSDRAHFGHWGFLRIDLEGRQYRWQAFNTDNRRMDQGTGNCLSLP